MQTDTDKRAQFEAGLTAGKSVKDLISELGLPKSTAYQWNAAIKDASNESAPPDSVPPPSVTTTKKRGGGGGARKMSVRPISEEAAGQLCAGMFFLAAALQNEQEWLLSDAERASLAGPLADSLRVMPAPIADAVNTYSAPAVFLSSLTAVVMAKGNRISQRRALVRRGVAVPPPAGVTDLRRRSAPAAPPPAAGDAQQNADLNSYEAEKPANAAPPVDPDVASAMAAARGSLTSQDEPDSGAALLEG